MSRNEEEQQYWQKRGDELHAKREEVYAEMENMRRNRKS